MKPITIGSRVSWTYEHHLNSKSSTWITKRGTVLEFVGEKKKRYVSGVFAKVHFDGNKHPSKVRVSELKPL